jgi:hypothetical protein
MGLQIGIKAHRLPILPRQGEVAPKATEGGGHGTEVCVYRPLRLASASHLPLAGEDRNIVYALRTNVGSSGPGIPGNAP